VLEQKLDEYEGAQAKLLHNCYVLKKLPEKAAEKVPAGLEADIASMHAELRAIDETADIPPRIVAMTVGELAQWWKERTLPEQRRVLKTEMERVVIKPAKRRGGNMFDTERVELVSVPKAA
jgi:hypothetical protein